MKKQKTPTPSTLIKSPARNCQYWLMKSEPEVFSIGALQRSSKPVEWDGVRNYQARNYMREMQVGDLFLFYHSNAEPSGVAGVGVIANQAHPDSSQFKKGGEYFEPRATAEQPVWECVDVAFHLRFKKPVSLEELRSNPKLKTLPLLQKGTRLSIHPVTVDQFREVCLMGSRL